MSTLPLSNEAVAAVPIVYGTIAHKLKKIVGQNTHRWTVFVRRASPTSLEQFIQSVTFKLHDSFPNPVRVITSPPFEVTESGWGEFVIHIRISFKNPRFKPLSLSHQLHLHHPLTVNPKHDAPVVSQVFDEVIFYDLPSSTNNPQTDYQPCTEPEAVKELEGIDKVIAHFEGLLEGGAS